MGDLNNMRGPDFSTGDLGPDCLLGGPSGAFFVHGNTLLLRLNITYPATVKVSDHPFGYNPLERYNFLSLRTLFFDGVLDLFESRL